MSTAKTLALVAAVAALSAAAGWWLGRLPGDAPAQSAAAPAPAQPEILYYRNPMGLPDTSPVPKKDSMGMDYVPVYAGEAPATPGTVVVSAERVQSTGVRTTTVERAPLASASRFPALLAVDESRRRAIAPRFEGWVETLVADQVGLPVRRGQALMRVYSPEFVAAQEEYLLAQRAAAALSGEAAANMRGLAEAALVRLRNWEVGAGALARLRGGDALRELTLTAPIDGVVTSKPVIAGARFMAGDTLLELTDFSQVWAVAQVPAREAAMLATGQVARFVSDTLPGREFAGMVTLLAPELDAATRTLAVRVELANPDGALRPALYGEIVIDAAGSEDVLQIPRGALLDSGARQWVFVELAPGRYAPRTVSVGRSAGERIEIREGLVEGETIVSAANFLIDAESSLTSALDGMSQGEPPSPHPSPASGGGGSNGPRDPHPSPASGGGGSNGPRDPHPSPASGGGGAQEHRDTTALPPPPPAGEGRGEGGHDAHDHHRGG